MNTYARLASIKKIIIFYRVKDWLHVLGLVILGYAYARPAAPDWNALLWILLAAALYLAHGYSLNDFFDNQIKSSDLNKNARTLSFIALGLCLLVCASISRTVLLLAIAGHICGMFYSARPWRFKNKPPWDIIFNAGSFIPLFFFGYVTTSNVSLQAIATGGLLFLFFFPIQIIHQMSDYSVDKESSQHNLTQHIGIKKSIILTLLLLLVYAAAGAWLWGKRIIPEGSFLTTGIFSVYLAWFVARAESYVKKNSMRDLKIVIRYISVFYGTALAITFYFNL